MTRRRSETTEIATQHREGKSLFVVVAEKYFMILKKVFSTEVASRHRGGKVFFLKNLYFAEIL